MLHLIPAPLHRLLLRLGHRLRRRWWRWRRPALQGVAVIAQDGEGRVLLVRLSYGSGAWCLPAGGQGPGEAPHAAMVREFAEELGAALVGLALLRVIEEPLHGASDRVHLFTARVEGPLRPDGREVIEAGFFHPDALPEPLERRVRPRLALLAQAGAATAG